MTYAKSGLFWSQCFLPSLVIRKAQAGGGKSSLGLLWFLPHVIIPDKRYGVHWVTLAVSMSILVKFLVKLFNFPEFSSKRRVIYG